MYIPMVDTLIASIDIENYDDVTEKIRRMMEVKKKEAKEVLTENLSKVVSMRIGDITFEVLSNGKKGYAYILHSDYYELDFAQFRSKNKDMFPIMVRLKSEALWSLGPEGAWKKVYSCIDSNVGQIVNDKISRIDICCHTDEFHLEYTDLDKFKGRYYMDNIYHFRRRITGMNFGSSATGKIYCRIYDKTLEVVQKKQKTWFFELWKQKGLNPKNVWNVEFQISREYLKDHCLNTVGQTYNSLASIWQYCTKYWLIKINIDHTRKENCSVDSSWMVLQNAFQNYQDTPLISRERQLRCEVEAMLPTTFGNITTFCAKLGISDDIMGLNTLRMYGAKYFELKKKSFQEIVKEKSKVVLREEKSSEKEIIAETFEEATEKVEKILKWSPDVWTNKEG